MPIGPSLGVAVREVLDIGKSLGEAHQVGVLRVDIEEVRFVRTAGPITDALSRQHRRKPILQQIDSCSPDAPRGSHSAQDHGVDPLADEDRGQVGTEKGRCTLLQDHGLVSSGSESRVDVHPPIANLELG